jgi:hyperosmotically inducible protein
VRQATKAALLLVWLLAALAAPALAQEKMQDKGGGFDDALITERVMSALNGDSMLREADIAVETHDGVVHLRGLVRTMAHVDRAGALARGVNGVSAVRNAIRVIDRPSRA